MVSPSMQPACRAGNMCTENARLRGPRRNFLASEASDVNWQRSAALYGNAALHHYAVRLRNFAVQPLTDRRAVQTKRALEAYSCRKAFAEAK